MPNTNEQKCLTRLLTSKDDAREQEKSKEVSLETMRDNGAKTDQEKILIEKQHKYKKTFITFRKYMKSLGKCVIDRGRVGTQLRDYCSELVDNKTLNYVLRKGTKVLYRNEIDISVDENGNNTRLEINKLLMGTPNR